MNLSKQITRIMLIFLLITFISNKLPAQEKLEKKNDAKYVLELIQESPTIEVFVFTATIYLKYSKEWLTNIEIKDNYIIFKKGDKIHSWKLDDIVFIEKTNKIVKISLSNTIRR